MKSPKVFYSRSGFITRLLLTFILFCLMQLMLPAQARFPLKVSADKRYLADQDDRPFPILGRTSWCVISQPVADYEAYIANSISHGFNSIEISVICHWPQSNYPPHNGRGDLPFVKKLDGKVWNGSLVYSDISRQCPDFTKPNEEYWQFVDTFLNYCESKGILVFFFPAYVGAAGTHEGWMNELVANGPERMQKYGRWIAERYKDQKNLIWMLIGDMGKFTPEQRNAEAAFIVGLKSVPGQQSPHYSAEPGSGQNSADQADFGNEMTLNGVYTWKGTDIPLLGNKAYSRTPVLPAFLLEEPYDEEGPDGNKFNPNAIQPVRRFQWWGWLTSIGGYMAGNGYIWPFIDLWWERHLNTKGCIDMERLNHLIRSVNWWELVPSGQNGMRRLIVAGGNTPADSGYVASAASPSGKLLIAYIPPAHRGTITVDMSVMTGKIRARWYDPVSGDIYSVQGSPFDNKETHEFTTPGKNQNGEADWALILDTPETISPQTGNGISPIIAPLKASSNPGYFQDSNGNTIILCGSQTWNTVQDWGSNGAVNPLDFKEFVRFLKAHGHNFTLLWVTELPVFHGLPIMDHNSPDITVSPFPWMRTGPGLATDGKPKFDLSKFNEEYFDRLYKRVKDLNDAEIYAGVYLFSGEWLKWYRFPEDGYPFTGSNNVNGINDGYSRKNPGAGIRSVTMTAPDMITDLQDIYVRKVIDRLNNLPNVLWIVSEEAPGKSTWWNAHLISLVKSYENGKQFRHPVGYAMPQELKDSVVFNSDADWIAPTGWLSPERSCGSGNPECKVNINDSDHSYWEMWNESPQLNRNYAWENFMTGNQVLFMDPYLVWYPRQNRNLCKNVANSIGMLPDSRWDNFRDNLGYILNYSRRLNLARVKPCHEISSTGFCLAQTPSSGAEYLIYAPAGGPFKVNLSAMPGSRLLSVEWFNPATGTTVMQEPVRSGSFMMRFDPPFKGDAVLYLSDTEGHNTL